MLYKFVKINRETCLVISHV